MEKKLKCTLIGSLTVLLVISSFLGCDMKTNSVVNNKINGDVQDAGKGFKLDKPLEFSMLYSDAPNYPYNEDWLLWKEIESRTNVSLKLTIVPVANYSQKRSFLITTGDAPYIIPKTYPGEESQYIASGAILPISDYVSKMPNFMKKVTEWKMQDDLKELMQKDGKYYLLPGLHEKPTQNYSLVVRTDILEKSGLKIPDSYEELYTLLKKLKELYPDITPWSDRYKFNAALGFASPTFGTTGGWNTVSGMLYLKDSDRYIFSPTTDRYRNMLSYFNRLVKEGLIDPESFTQSEDQAVLKFINGKSFVISGNSQDMADYRKKMDAVLGVGKYKISRIVNPSGPEGSIINGSRLENGIMISSKAAKDPNFDQMLKFIDWLWYSDEGQTLTKWGVEGITYNVVNGKKQLADDINFNNMNSKGTKNLRTYFGFSGGVFSYAGSQELKYSMMSQEDIEFQSTLDKTKQLVLPAPPVLFSDVEREQTLLYEKPLVEYANQMTLKFMLGTLSIDLEWDRFVQECKAKGKDKLEDITNKVYKNSKLLVK